MPKQQRPALNRYAWQKKRAQVRARDGNRCTRCGTTERLSVHHIVKARHGGPDTLDNLTTLCPRCHAAADAGRFFSRPQPHPLSLIHI